MNKGRSTVLALSLVVFGLFIPIVPRLITGLIWPHWYDDPLFDADRMRFDADPLGFSLMVAWNALPFGVLALVAYIALTRSLASGRQEATILGGVLGALIPGLVVGVWIHTPDPERVGVNFGVGFFPFYMLILMPVGFGLGALLVKSRVTRATRP